jgi:hypothetical protein
MEYGKHEKKTADKDNLGHFDLQNDIDVDLSS